jgi:hypothetical protein
MKTFANSRFQAAWPVAAVSFLLLASAAALAAPAEVYHKKDGAVIMFTGWMGGEHGSGPVYFWLQYVPNTVVKTQEDGSYWIHDCSNEAIVIIGTNPDYVDSKEDPQAPPSEVLYTGTGSVSLAGIWIDPGTGWLIVGDKMNYQFKATVVDAHNGRVWKLFWHAVERDGEWTETFTFEPVK